MVRDDNKRAVRFYERLGYARIGTKTVRVGKKPLLGLALDAASLGHDLRPKYRTIGPSLVALFSCPKGSKGF